MIIVIGGGVAGLTAARVLFRARVPFALFERDDTLGGRVRTDVTADGYRLDRGFQVLFTRYPAVRRHLDLAQLGVRAFTPGAVIMTEDGERHDLDDPLRVPAKVWRTLRSPVLSLADKGRVALEVADLRLRTAEGIWTDRDTTTLAYLHERGFSSRAIEQFFRPFFGGIFFDRALSTSSNAFRFTYKMLAEGDTVVPALGMGELPRQLAAGLPPASIRTGAAVTELSRTGDRVTGVRVAGELVEGDAVILAADGPSAAALSGLPLPATGVGGTTLYFAGPEPLLTDKKVLLNAAPDPFINEVVQITNIAPDYAPPGDHLLAVSIVGHLNASGIESRARHELVGWFGEAAVERQRLVGTYSIPFGQFPQLPGFSISLPSVRSGIEGLYIGGEATRASSINGAIEAGEVAAQAVLDDLGVSAGKRIGV